MNYINFKGIDSRSLQGLIIQELPPITKPEMRVQSTVIDGKDGDIQENIGYSAYDKTLKIGLSRKFDINEIIKYFNGNGDVIFSNEPDKVYEASIVKQIDYERLLTFRTANVKIHVQPYKYLLNELAVDVTINNETEVVVNNVGLEIAKPIINLYGSGIVEISINDYAQFQIDIDDESVTIDCEEQEAYKGNNLKNHLMIGEFPIFEVGENVITWTGILEKIVVIPKSRWL